MAIKLQRLEGGGLGFWKGIFRRKHAVVTEQVVAVGQAGIRQRVARIILGSLAEILDRFLQPLGRPLVPKIAPPQVKLISLGINRLSLGELFFLLTTQLERECLGHLSGYCVLESKDVSEVLIELL